jgi:hypothetical protein
MLKSISTEAFKLATSVSGRGIGMTVPGIGAIADTAEQMSSMGRGWRDPLDQGPRFESKRIAVSYCGLETDVTLGDTY